MIYVGSKKRIITQIGPIIARHCGGVIVEPFCGGLNATQWFVKQGLQVEASDNNRYLIALYKMIATGGSPMFINTKVYEHARRYPGDFLDHTVGWAGIGCSYSGKWFGGYADFTVTNNGKDLRCYQLERKRSLLAMRDLIVAVKPFEADYYDILPTRKTVYLDPPYRRTIKYVDQFDHDKFYGYCEKLKSRNNQVFISEYEMPSEFTEVWSSQLNCHIARTETPQNKIERLYTI